MNLKKLVLTAIASAFCFTAIYAQDNAEAAKPADAQAAEAKPVEDKLLPLITMEQAFAKALQNRNILAQYINNEVEKYKKAEEKDKAAIEENIKNARNKLAELNTYMDVIFGLGGRRAYEYNRVTSEIYLTVGTVSEVFTRAIATRDALAKQIAAVKEAIDKEQDAEKKKALEANQTALVQRYALIVNALFNIYQVHPVRNYHFDAATRTLFLKTNDAEVTKLQEQIKKAAEERKATEEKKAE